MRLVVIESPFRSSTEEGSRRNRAYLKACIKDCVNRGEAPYASHAIMPLVLDDNSPMDRDYGIRSGYAWQRVADLVAFYIDLGESGGMILAHAICTIRGIPCEMRRVDPDLMAVYGVRRILSLGESPWASDP